MELVGRDSAQDGGDMPFLNSDLQRSIMAASHQAKTLLCFVTDGTNTSSQWEAVVSDTKYRAKLTLRTITLKINAGTQEAQYLSTVCPLNGLPAIVAVKRGSIEENLQHPQVTISDLQAKFDRLFGSDGADQDSNLNEHEPTSSSTPVSNDPSAASHMYITLPPSTGRMRLPNNAYDALSVQTQKWIDQGIRGDNILKLQLKLLGNIPAMGEAVTEIEKRHGSVTPELSSSQQDRLLNTPATALRIVQSSTPSSSSTEVRQSDNPMQLPAGVQVQQGLRQQDQAPRQRERGRLQQQRQQEQDLQRINYVQAQRERETAERAGRERIKAQIASDRAAQRHLDDVRRQAERRAELDTLRQSNSTTANPQSTDIRIQVRTFDGSTIRASFARNVSITSHIRPWIEETSKPTMPYNLKLILTPLPNRTIEAGEEDRDLSDLGIVASATMVMVPVKGYVDSYAGNGNGIVSAVSGAVGGVLGGLGNLIGWGGINSATAPPASNDNTDATVRNTADSRVRVRTLADQRAEEAKKQSNELYNGNQLNFQGRKDDETGQKHD